MLSEKVEKFVIKKINTVKTRLLQGSETMETRFRRFAETTATICKVDF